MAGLAILLAANPASRSTAPDFRPEPARAAAGRALGKIRPALPAAARHIDRLIADAEIATASEASAPFWQKSPGRAEVAWTRVLVTARESLVQIHSSRATWSDRWISLSAELEREIDRARAESDEAGVGRREIAAAQRASVQWDVAQRLAAAGRFDRAVAAGEVARSLVGVVHESWNALHSRFSDPRNLRKWRAMVAEAIAQSRASGQTAFVVDKLKRKLYVYRAGERVGAYEAELGAKGLRQKIHAGDQATPEGRYRITQVKAPNQTKYYKALLLDYPNGEDRARFAFARQTGQVPLRVGIGSLIEIHGEGGQGRDWTDGCVALSNTDMDRVFAQARVGTPVTIVGTF
ncbi:MAG: L,D-transpeptidase [Thermoanaerobaculia bacterium]